MKHVNIHISGKVQGVFFRASAKEQADYLGVRGFVRNEPNGEVYMEAEGEENQLNEFLEWCKHGPRRSKVEQVKIEESASKNFRLFEVKR
jgi:acylphosphatase